MMRTTSSNAILYQIKFPFKLNSVSLYHKTMCCRDKVLQITSCNQLKLKEPTEFCDNSIKLNMAEFLKLEKQIKFMIE